MNNEIQTPDEQPSSARFVVELEAVNSAFGISADTLNQLAQSYGVSPERLLVRAITMLALADIPGLDLDAPQLSPDQQQFLKQRREQHPGASTTSLNEAFKRLFEGTGHDHENAESQPLYGRHP
jgi:hypothetical protein